MDKKYLDSVFSLVSSADTEEAQLKLAHELSEKTGLELNYAFTFVTSLRFTLENQAVLLDALLDLITSIVRKLEVHGALTQEDLNKIKEEMSIEND